MKPRVIILFATACVGAWTHCGGLVGSDAGVDASTDDAANDDVAVVDGGQGGASCDRYFVEVDTDAGSSFLWGGCGSPVPGRACLPYGSTCQGVTGIDACDGGAGLFFALDLHVCWCDVFEAGVYSAQTEYLTEDGGVYFGTSTVNIDSVGATAATGTYDSVFTYDGGKKQLHGTFCVQP